MTGLKGFKGQRGSLGKGQKGQRGEPGYCFSSGCLDCLCRRKRSDASEVDSYVDSAEFNTPGVVYTRWGESTCPENSTKMIFSGKLASTTAASYLCLPFHHDLQNDKEEPANQQIYSNIDSTTLRTSEVPCSVCLALKQNTVLTVPAKVTCPSGWTREYYGFVINGSSEDGQYHCMDGSGGNHSKSWLDHIKVDCNDFSGSGCHDNIECAVCTL